MIVGVVGVRSRWVGGGDPLENSNLKIGWARADSYVYDLGMVVWCAWMTKCVSKIGWEAVIECKGLEIRPIRGGYMLTNQSEGARNSTNQSLPPRMQCAVPF